MAGWVKSELKSNPLSDDDASPEEIAACAMASVALLETISVAHLASVGAFPAQESADGSAYTWACDLPGEFNVRERVKLLKDISTDAHILQVCLCRLAALYLYAAEKQHLQDSIAGALGFQASPAYLAVDALCAVQLIFRSLSPLQKAGEGRMPWRSCLRPTSSLGERRSQALFPAGTYQT